MNKNRKFLYGIFIVVFVSLIFIITLSKSGAKTYTIDKINNPRKIQLPLDNVDEAIEYSLSLKQVREELNKPLEEPVASYDWKASAYDNSPNNWWQIYWFKGGNEWCYSNYGCAITIRDNGSSIGDNISCGRPDCV